MRNSSSSHLYLLYLTIFIDAIGLGIVFPVMPLLFINHSSYILNPFNNLYTQDILLGLILSAFPFAMFLGSPVIGSISDKIGRKKTLVACLIGNGLGFFLCVVAIKVDSISLLFVGRIISGLTSGSVPTAQAAIIDLSPPEKKSVRLGLTSATNGIGFALGPLLGGVFTNSNFIHGASISLPFIFCFVLSVINAILIAFLFKESYQGNAQQKVGIFTGIQNIIGAFKFKKTGILSIVFFLYILGYFGFMQYLSILLDVVYKQSATNIGKFLSYYAVWFVFSLMVLFPQAVKKFSTKGIITTCLLVQPCSVLIFLLVNSLTFKWFIIGPMAIAFSFCYVSIMTEFSNAVGAEEQGKIMGVVASLFALAWGLIPSISGILQGINIMYPLVFFVLLLASSAIINLVQKKYKEPIRN